MAPGPIDESPEVPELQGPPEVLEAIDQFLTDPSTGVRAGRPKHKGSFPVYRGGQTFFPEQEQAEVESKDDSSPHWLLIVGVGLVVVGLLVRWYLRRK